MAGVRGFLILEQILSRAMDAATLRQQIAANNIANVNTPGFRRSFVRFEEELAVGCARTGSCGGSYPSEAHSDRHGQGWSSPA